MKRGRPAGSQIRQNIIEVLYFMGEGYAYQVYKAYCAAFNPVSMRSIYYHLRKGLSTEEFVVKEVRKEKGDYSWGPEAEKTYYGLGPKAAPKVDLKVRDRIKELSNK